MISINEAKRLIKRALLANIVSEKQNLAITPLVSGKHGIGKSAMIKSIAQDLGGVCITVEGGTLKEGEITGLPYQYKDEKGQTRFRFLPYYAIERIQNEEKRIFEESGRELDENTALFPVERLKYGSRTLVAFYNAMKRKIGILYTAYDNERSVRYQRGEVPHFKVSADAVKFITDKGCEPEYGARPIRRAVERMVEDPLALDLLAGKFDGAKTIELILQGDKLVFKSRKRAKKMREGDKITCPSCGVESIVKSTVGVIGIPQKGLRRRIWKTTGKNRQNRMIQHLYKSFTRRHFPP